MTVAIRQDNGVHLHRKLQQFLPGVISKRYKKLPFENGEIVPTQASLKPGAMEVVRERIEEFGEAQIIGDGAYDFPTVNMHSDEDPYRILMVGAGFGITFQAERAAQFANYPLRDSSMKVARRVIAEKANRIAAYGVAGDNTINGHVNDPLVSLSNSSFEPYAVSGVTASDDLIGFFLEELEAVVSSSNAVEMAGHFLISHRLNFQLMKTKIPNSGVNVRQFLLENDNYIESITAVNELRPAELEANGVEAAGAGKERIVLYSKDPEVVERHIEPVDLLPPEYTQVQSARRVFPLMQCVTPTIINYPGAMSYISYAA